MQRLIRFGRFLIAGLAMLLVSTGLQAQPAGTRANLSGILNIVWGDPHREFGAGGSTLYSLALPDGTIVPLQMAGQENAAAHLFGKRVSISGRIVPGGSATPNMAGRAPVAVDRITSAELPSNDVQAAAVVGTKRVIYLLLKFSDDVSVPHPPSFFSSLNNPDIPPPGANFPATINGFFKRVSWNQFSWLGDVGGVGGVGAPGGWLTLPNPKSYYAPCGWSSTCANLQAIGDDGTALGRAQGINFKNYDNINFVLSNDLDCCAWGGGYFSAVDAKSYGSTWEPPWGQEAGTYAHEMGHSLGLPHSGWVYHAYDSPWDMMSDRRSASSMVCGSYASKNDAGVTRNLTCTEPGNGYIAAHQDYLGWIPPANQILTSTTGPSLTVTLEAAALPLGSLSKMIKICLAGLPCTGSSAHYFTVEARVGGLGTTSQFDNGVPGNGVIVHEFRGDRQPVGGPCFFNSQSGWAFPVDTTPNDYDSVSCQYIGTYPEYALYNAQLSPGETYTNNTYGFRVAVLSQTASTFVVAVSASNYTITLGASPIAGGTVSGAGTFAAGSSRTVTATANSGYTFVNWTENGTVVSTATSYVFTLNSNRSLVAGFTAITHVTNDLNGDGKSDVLFRNNDGSLAVVLMDGALASSVVMLAGKPPGWGVAGVEDFTGDGKADILWRHTDGSVEIWLMNGAAISSTVPAGIKPTTWALAGTGDFNGDGKADILWRHTDGSVEVWLMNGAAIASAAPVGIKPAGWSVAGTGDFNGDGKADILWRHTDGSVELWLMNGAAITGTAGVGVVPPSWSVAGVADFSGDRKADILWRNIDGSVAMLLMDGASIAGSAVLGSVPLSWSVAAARDFNGDGKADILWRNIDGSVAMLFMNGMSITSNADLGVVPTVWTVVP